MMTPSQSKRAPQGAVDELVIGWLAAPEDMAGKKAAGWIKVKSVFCARETTERFLLR